MLPLDTQERSCWYNILRSIINLPRVVPILPHLPAIGWNLKLFRIIDFESMTQPGQPIQVLHIVQAVSLGGAVRALLALVPYMGGREVIEPK